MTNRDSDRKVALDGFREAVNMAPAELEAWLATEESRSAGQHTGGRESIGHASGRRIVTLLRRPDSELSAGDLAHMRKVTGYVHRHLAQQPKGDITDTTWRHSLMNWGHDPKK
ncbi:DUF3140 domain-containing protein [Actinospica sp. MGRD01-02]|uniref:DUF3140 domain-containing protein n=1 Tax=Actinospica acidithermotolerans TaxID=2828514 RepID=A0A941EF62_9ACTN|nr:DUF3140 domain-containing protein [Actinospica acidithermotolerans]MBR7829293.1 DUF3140 domain-containing protein [Actinospica acidithermotolerans]